MSSLSRGAWIVLDPREYLQHVAVDEREGEEKGIRKIFLIPSGRKQAGNYS